MHQLPGGAVVGRAAQAVSNAAIRAGQPARDIGCRHGAGRPQRPQRGSTSHGVIARQPAQRTAPERLGPPADEAGRRSEQRVQVERASLDADRRESSSRPCNVARLRRWTPDRLSTCSRRRSMPRGRWSPARCCSSRCSDCCTRAAADDSQPARARARGSIRSAVAHARRYGGLRCFAGALVALLAALVSPIDALGTRSWSCTWSSTCCCSTSRRSSASSASRRSSCARSRAASPDVERGSARSRTLSSRPLLYVATMGSGTSRRCTTPLCAHGLLHALEHVSFGIAGGLYWWHLLSPIRGRHRLTGMGPVVYMLATKLRVGLLGIVLTFAPRRRSTASTRRRERVWGMDPAHRPGSSPARSWRSSSRS